MTTGFSIGDAVGRVIIDASGVRAGIAEAKRSILGGFNDLGAGMQEFGGALTVLTAPLTAFGVTGIKAAGDFDDAMRELSARTGIVGEDLDKMRQAAIDAGAATVFGASDAANSLLQLTSSGLTAQEALAVLPAVMNGAAAAGSDLGSTADWITDIMAAFGLEADQATYVIDSLVAASGSGSATVADLAMGFQNAGGIASMFGLSVDETAAALQIFSENGIKGAEAGTQLKSMLNNMTRDTEDVQVAWNALGISMFDVAGNARPLNDVIQDLNARLNDGSYTQEEQISILQTLGGSYGMLGLQALIGADGLQGMLNTMDSAADSATVAEAKMGGWRGMLENLSGSIETFQLQVLSPFINDTLIPLGLQAADMVNRFTAWAAKNPELSNTIVMIAAALAVLGPTLVIVGQFIKSTSTLFSLAGTAIGALTSPIGLIILAAGLLAYAWFTNFGGIQEKTQAVIDAVIPKLESIFDALKNGDVAGAVGVVTDLAANIQTAITDALPGIQAQLGTWIAAFIDWIGPLLEEWLLALPGIQATILKFIMDSTPGIVTQLLEWATAFVEWLGPATADLIVALGELLAAVIEWLLAEMIPAMIAEWPGLIASFIGFAWNLFTDVLPALDQFLSSLVTFFTVDIANAVIEAAKTIGQGVIDGIKGGIENAWSGFVSYLEDKLGSGLVGQVAEFLGIMSPSRVFRDQIGKNIIAGLAVGLADTGPIDAQINHLIGALMPSNLTALGLSGAAAGQTPSAPAGKNFYITVEVTPDMLRDMPTLENNAALFGQRLTEALQAQG